MSLHDDNSIWMKLFYLYFPTIYGLEASNKIEKVCPSLLQVVLWVSIKVLSWATKLLPMELDHLHIYYDKKVILLMYWLFICWSLLWSGSCEVKVRPLLKGTLRYLDPSISPSVPILIQHDMGVGMGSLLDTPILL